MVPNVCEGQFNRQLKFVAVTDKKRFYFFSPKLSDFNAEHSRSKGQKRGENNPKLQDNRTDFDWTVYLLRADELCEALGHNWCPPPKEKKPEGHLENVTNQ